MCGCNATATTEPTRAASISRHSFLASSSATVPWQMMSSMVPRWGISDDDSVVIVTPVFCWSSSSTESFLPTTHPKTGLGTMKRIVHSSFSAAVVTAIKEMAFADADGVPCTSTARRVAIRCASGTQFFMSSTATRLAPDSWIILFTVAPFWPMTVPMCPRSIISLRCTFGAVDCNSCNLSSLPRLAVFANTLVKSERFWDRRSLSMGVPPPILTLAAPKPFSSQ
mmetsp:Transcript_6477/g.13964  ORF Transcript_6477/g.13964 Transcript_6477/m.13964 type:complete len:225 (+) Transcript_6477:206-880(+)